ncbi:hypothetical protein B0A48_06366 [Cryoendolithus antarcticus]|uniref:Uncharacterized protein n=1 Tax=Cryoendolithus antarcticus TaxID=1507870 RepID=A0A1V8TAT0_9PEZI|nr:hypothetical protein B0A48_06366 [Cryoendolithus antarcticus]OQO28996.1 hypothetical protein B0A51_03578 [Rachicladosporium sp. CCFEE 5018]
MSTATTTFQVPTELHSTPWQRWPISSIWKSTKRTLTPTRFSQTFAEPHPVARRPAYLQQHRWAGSSYYMRRLGRASGVFFPGMIAFFGWPFAMQWAIDYNNGVYRAKKEEKASEPHHKSHRKLRKLGIDAQADFRGSPA